MILKKVSNIKECNDENKFIGNLKELENGNIETVTNRTYNIEIPLSENP